MVPDGTNSAREKDDATLTVHSSIWPKFVMAKLPRVVGNLSLLGCLVVLGPDKRTVGLFEENGAYDESNGGHYHWIVETRVYVVRSLANVTTYERDQSPEYTISDVVRERQGCIANFRGKGFHEIGGDRSINHANINYLHEHEQDQHWNIRVRCFLRRNDFSGLVYREGGQRGSAGNFISD